MPWRHAVRYLAAMNIGIYQSASSLGALERWQDTVTQNIASSQRAGFRKRTTQFTATTNQANVALDPNHRGDAVSLLFPEARSGINFITGETQPTRRDLDVALQ